MSLWFYFTFVWCECSHGYRVSVRFWVGGKTVFINLLWSRRRWKKFAPVSKVEHAHEPHPPPPPGLRPSLTFLTWGSAGVVPQPLLWWNLLMLKLMLQFAFEQGGTDLQMYIHEWLQQWRQLWKLKDIIATGKRSEVHRLVVTFIGVTTSMAK